MWKNRRDNDSSPAFAALADNLAVSAMVFLMLFFVLAGLINAKTIDDEDVLTEKLPENEVQTNADAVEHPIEIKLEHGVEIVSGYAINLPFKFRTAKAKLPSREEIEDNPDLYAGYTAIEDAQHYLKKEILPRLVNNPDIAYIEVQGHADSNPTCEEIRSQKNGNSRDVEREYQSCIKCETPGQFCSNWMISSQRAAHILELMLQEGNQSVDRNPFNEKFIITAHASNQPLQGMEAKDKENRRVQIIAYNQQGEQVHFKGKI